jgi:predicted RNase H-like nuclease (RuvC/YqgF family)
MGDASNADARRQVEELLRVNAELAAEIRSLQAGRTTAPRSAAMPAARRVGALREERDSLAAELQESRLELARVEQHNQELGRQGHEQARHIEILSGEVARLRTGFAGVLRRLRARLLRR